MPAWWDWKWLVTALIALWGAGLSTITAIQRRRETSPDVCVSLSVNTIMLAPDADSIGQRLSHGRVSEVGGSLRDVQFLAGHASIAVTQRYVDCDPAAQRKLVERL